MSNAKRTVDTWNSQFDKAEGALDNAADAILVKDDD